MGSGICKESGCDRPISTGKPSLQLCYGHLKHHPEAPLSIRARAGTATRGARKPEGGGRPKAGRAVRRPKGNGIACGTCGQPLPSRMEQAVRILQENGVKELAVAIRAAGLVLGVAG